MNQVDTSPEKVESEWRKIERDFNLNPLAGERGGEHIPGDNLESAGEELEIIYTEQEIAEKKEITKQLINGGLKMAFFMVKVDDIPASVTDDFCQAWAEVIVKRFPDNPVTDFMEAYGDLISAGGATLVLIGAVRTSKTKAQLQEEIKKDMKKNVEGFENGE
jgi:hypothetical protein